jgi:hypothetical protein
MCTKPQEMAKMPEYPWLTIMRESREELVENKKCNDATSKANYLGPRRNFDFSTYVAIHQQAHQDVHRHCEPVPENKKVCDFLHGIHEPQCSN